MAHWYVKRGRRDSPHARGDGKSCVGCRHFNQAYSAAASVNQSTAKRKPVDITSTYHLAPQFLICISTFSALNQAGEEYEKGGRQRACIMMIHGAIPLPTNHMGWRAAMLGRTITNVCGERPGGGRRITSSARLPLQPRETKIIFISWRRDGKDLLAHA